MPQRPTQSAAELVGAGHSHKLTHHGHSVVHRLGAHVKVLALLGFMLVVVATPGDWYAAFGVYFLALVVVVVISQVPASHLLPRMLIETPFVVFAVLMPFVATGPRIEVLGLMVSQSGLIAGWTLLVKATLGVIAGLTLAATTEPQDLVRGLSRLHLPDLMVQIMGFMIRYLDVVGDDLRRQHVALTSRGFVARDPRHWPVLGKSAGALFIRSFERGERVHLAMLSRGYTGRLP
ncbi:cobalt ECF transporter T component CbiQ [Aeromicrobium wangtongii]|uniref:Cobalt ECF transporter T component CbiQ n=1 Tax=Aeromicrobium wangtongii TaxID=2969247 RepID=A0ABY5M6I8_9ACTN|nr:cobalt ECF transporter T component CbiQ [Aeromicrobium wangtongii]MCD9198660.1 cobalt ECF transporter T component CbiQ [Aeromicrobium wangtongii]UUP12684.1 cobalt ECF transporter T component CbiQ [Aeromicrobium wangtongii]